MKGCRLQMLTYMGRAAGSRHDAADRRPAKARADNGEC